MLSPEIIRQNRIVYLRMPKKYLSLYKKFKLVEVENLKYAKRLKYEGQTIIAYTPWSVDIVWMVWAEKKREYNFLGQKEGNFVPLIDLIGEKIISKSKNRRKKAEKSQIKTEVLRKFGAEILWNIEYPIDPKKVVKFLKFFSETEVEVKKVLIALMFKSPSELEKDHSNLPVEIPQYTERWYREIAKKAGGYRFLRHMKPARELIRDLTNETDMV